MSRAFCHYLTARLCCYELKSHEKLPKKEKKRRLAWPCPLEIAFTASQHRVSCFALTPRDLVVVYSQQSKHSVAVFTHKS